MDRRNALKSVAFAAASAGLVAAGAETTSAKSAKTSAAPPKIARTPFIETKDGARLFYKDWGVGKPLVFISSWALNSDMWQYQMLYLAGQGLRCVAYDRRGHGRSSQPGTGYNYDTLADDLAAVVEQLDLREVTLIGHSMAGGEIVRYLSRHGASRIARIVLLAPTTPFLLKTPDNPDGVPAEAFDQLRAAWRKDFPKWLAANAQPFFVADTSREMMDWVLSLILQCSLLAAIECNHAITETDFRAEMRKITVPTLIIHGDKDVSTPIDLTGRKSAQLVPDCRFLVYEGAPHGLMFTHTDRLNADLLAFTKS